MARNAAVTVTREGWRRLGRRLETQEAERLAASGAIRSGKLRGLAVTSLTRNPALPDIPTVMESGLKDFEVVGFYGFLAPAGLPADITARLSDAFRQVMTSADWLWPDGQSKENGGSRTI